MPNWIVANNTPVWMQPRRTVYFLVRYQDPADRRTGREDLCDARGRLRTWRTADAAQRAAVRLNAAS